MESEANPANYGKNQAKQRDTPPGDLVLLDADGAIALASARTSTILEAARARAQNETALRTQLQSGALSYDLSGLRAVVEGSMQR